MSAKITNAVYIHIEDAWKVVAAENPYKLSRLYKDGQGILLDGKSFTVLKSFIFRGCYHVLLSDTITGAMAMRIEKAES